MTLDKGDAVPDFELTDQDGEIFRLSDHKGRRLVLFFYPKDNTPGCTREATGFSMMEDQFAALGVTVVGISPDSEASHVKFRDKHDIGVRLLSDPEHVAMEPLGVWAEKKNYGRTYMGVVRSTFLIDENGHLVGSWRNVKVDGHVDKVLAAAQKAFAT